MRKRKSYTHTFTAGSDYIAEVRAITFVAGQTQVLIPVATINDDRAEQSEDLVALLSNPSEGLTIGARSRATVTITDDESENTIAGVKK